MNRVILTPAALPSSALAELKQWLGITTGGDDALLTALLAAALETCEAFIGALPLEATCEERLPARAGWHTLATRPVQAIAAIEGLTADGARIPLDPASWEADLDADGAGLVRLPQTLPLPGVAKRVAVRFTAGLTADWDALPDTLRHGVVRLAAHQHRERDTAGAAPLPPASVAALWRPLAADAAGMIEADAPFEALAKRLAARAATLAAAHAAARLLGARGDERRWRRAGLVWPLFAKG